MSAIRRLVEWFQSLFRPQVELPPTPGEGIYLTREQVVAVIKAALGKKWDTLTYIRMADNEYYCPTIAYFLQILGEDETDRLTYVAEIGDCDDFSWTLKDMFVRDAWRNGRRRAPHCVGVFDYTRKGGRHSINWVITADKVFRLTEPQTDAWVSLSDVVVADALIA